MSERQLNLTDDARARLRELLTSDKFAEDLEHLYPGAATSEQRVEYESYANDLISRVAELPDTAAASDVFDLFRACLRNFEYKDTEDRERICIVCECVMDAVGIDSSNGLLNEWLYGYDIPGSGRNA